ncbi:MAG: branched-chain amino acid aminotransferase [Chitinophagales bacterium]|nr:branched-chain amino acid aminotransferase [Chitinophagales bacterium]MDW8273169.1 branched-chain amino acid aminotransferase [Chitinophagales bacterium]
MSHHIEIIKTPKSRISEVDFKNLPFGRHFSDHIFISDYYDGEWRDCRIVPFEDFSLHPATSALHYGQALFEGLKAEYDVEGNPVVFRPNKNIKRLNISAQRMAMPIFPEDLFFRALDLLLSIDLAWIPKEPNSSLYIRPYMFATEKYVGIKVAEHYRFAMFTCPVGAYYSRPVKVYIHDYYVRAFPGGTGFAKAAGNYGACMMPMREVQKMGYDQILWLDGIHHKYLQEIGTMNIFVIIDGVIITPSLEMGTILDGVTRDSIIRIAEDEGFIVQERDISVDEVINAYHEGKLEDMFGTGTAATIAPIQLFHYKGEDYVLPPLEKRTISERLKERYFAIRSGRAEDIYGWLHTIPVELQQV